MQAWKVTYYDTNPSERFSIGICGDNQDDVVKNLQRITGAKRPIIENIDFLGVVHALTPNTEKKVHAFVEKRLKKHEEKVHEHKSKEPKPQKTKVEETKEEHELSQEVECSYCQKVCKDENELAKHEEKCSKKAKKESK